MTSDLDRKFDETLAAILGPGGRIVLDRDDQGRPIVANFPATLPSLLRTFCALNAATEALIAGDERFTFAELDDVSERLARALVGRGIAKGERVAIAMRNCPAWIVTHMAVLKAGAVATLLNGWWQAHEMEHALKLSSPALVIADG
ncbi:MAG TPA: AMP-binding protein, partial [Sphingomicrobium sp.]|nr:AMP-binding protein [Sphingomicrobium sp.]